MALQAETANMCSVPSDFCKARVEVGALLLFYYSRLFWLKHALRSALKVIILISQVKRAQRLAKQRMVLVKTAQTTAPHVMVRIKNRAWYVKRATS